MPHLVRMDKRYSEKGLKVIAAECQNSSADAIEGVAKDNRAKFSITQGTTRPTNMSGIPHAVVFDSSGKLIFSGSPSDSGFDRNVKAALKNVELVDEDEEEEPADAGPVIAQRSWTNTDGKKIKAAITKIEGEKVTFKLPNGKEISYEVAKLSEDDQEVIKEAAEAAEEDDEE
jgi:hypothetical protein